MKKILITAFEPFDGKEKNASLEILSYKPIDINKTIIKKVILPTSFKRVEKVLLNAIDTFEPDVIILLGEASHATHIRLERIGINLIHARIPDNDGYQPFDQIIKSDGQNAYFSTLPTHQIYERLTKQNIPVKYSFSAGTFLCNDVLYIVLYTLSKRKTSHVKAGFIHFPYIKNQLGDVNHPYLDIEISHQALTEIIRSCLI